MEGGLKETLGWGWGGANDGVRELWRRAGLDERVCCWTSVDGREGVAYPHNANPPASGWMHGSWAFNFFSIFLPPPLVHHAASLILPSSFLVLCHLLGPLLLELVDDLPLLLLLAPGL